MDQQRKTIAQMRELLATTTAQPLLPDGVPGPVRVAGSWWAVPAGTDTYVRMADASIAEEWDSDLDRRRRLRAAVDRRRAGLR